MKIWNQFKKCAANGSLALTIGNFDGVHLGHQALLRRLKQACEKRCVVTFSTHPSVVLHQSPISYLTTLSHRLSLFEKMGIDETFLIPFSKEFSKLDSKTFLTTLKNNIPFTHLILGHDAVIGHDRNHDLYDLSHALNFTLEYLEPVQIDGKIVSSSEIRKCIQLGNLEQAGIFLGRPYSIFASVGAGQGKGKKLGFHTANLPVEELALPPFGVYAVEVKLHQEKLPAVANLGHAPTLHMNRPPCLEVHLIDEQRNLYGEELEVFFLKYLRQEKRFENPEALKLQIEKDIKATKEMFTQAWM